MNWWLKFSGLLISLAIIVSIGFAIWPLTTHPDSKIKFSLPKVAKGVTLAGREVGNSNQIEVTKTISNLTTELETEPQPAVQFQGQIRPGKAGKKINITKTLAKTLTAAPEEELTPVYETIDPLITKDHLVKDTSLQLPTGVKAKVISHFTTYLKNNQVNRRTNIKLAVKKLTDQSLASGEKFSFNQLIGEPERKEGYKPAPVIIDDKLEPRVGGGICQVSSTLYKVVKKADLEVLERHAHSKSVAYIPPGEDATVYPGQKDFRFKNNTEHKLKLKGAVIDRQVAIYLLQLETTNLNL